MSSFHSGPLFSMKFFIIWMQPSSWIKFSIIILGNVITWTSVTSTPASAIIFSAKEEKFLFSPTTTLMKDRDMTDNVDNSHSNQNIIIIPSSEYFFPLRTKLVMLVVTTFIYPYERLIDNSLDPGYLWSVTCWSCRGGWRRCTWCRGTAWTPAPACASHSSAQRSSHTLQFNIHNMDVITQVATLHWGFTPLSKIISCLLQKSGFVKQI